MLDRVKEEAILHFSDTFSNRPTGVHGKELPKFSENLKEYWQPKNCPSSQSSSKKIFKNPLEKNIFHESEFENSDRKSGINKAYQEIVLKPNQIEQIPGSPSKEYMKNSRWTNYHYNFIQKTMNEAVKESKSFTPDIKTKTKPVKSPKSLIIQRMLKKGNFSPVKDKFRSTGFA